MTLWQKWFGSKMRSFLEWGPTFLNEAAFIVIMQGDGRRVPSDYAHCYGMGCRLPRCFMLPGYAGCAILRQLQLLIDLLLPVMVEPLAAIGNSTCHRDCLQI